MPLPLIAIVGRPNVGKSSLFNRLVRRPIAIVDPTPGTTRDRLIHQASHSGKRFELIDTGGIGIVDEAKLEADVYAQVERAIHSADRVIFVVDGRDGILPLDLEIAAKLRPLKARVVLAVNKLDHDGIEQDSHIFERLGLGTPIAISAAAARGITDLVERMLTGLDAPAVRVEGDGLGDLPEDPQEPDDGRIRICLAGRRNVGKSSLTNALCGEERVIVADFAGTTRDAIDVPLSRPEGEFTLIDTAGLRKKNQIEQDLEFYAACRTERAIRRAHVVLLVLDASDEVGNIDKKLAHYCEVEGKPTVLVVNKWDIAEKAGSKRDTYVTWLRDRLPGLAYAPITFTCALTGYNLADALRLSVELHGEARSRVTTSELNDHLAAAIERRRPKRVAGTAVKLYYGTQVETSPPSFLVFVNRTDWVDPSWARFFENFLRERLPFRRIPIVIRFKARDSRFREMNDERAVTIAKPKAGRSATLIVPKNARRRKPDEHRPPRRRD